jgi:mycothiol synthase
VAVDVNTPAALDESSAAAVRALASGIEARDGQPPLSDRALTHLTSSAVHHAVAYDDAELIGYGQVEDGSAEVALADDRGAALLDAITGDIAEIWSHGTRSPLRALLGERGFQPTRVLHQLRRPGALTLSSAEPPPDVVVTTFRVGQDEAAWLAVNAAAFAHHPEQGGVTLDDLAALEAESWFSADGFFLAWRGEQLLGYHWTKVHPSGDGEVYVLGISPAAQGLGLGRVLLDIGLRHLSDVGCPEVLL